MTRHTLATFAVWTAAAAGLLLITLTPAPLTATDPPATEGGQALPLLVTDTGTSLSVELTNAAAPANPLLPFPTLKPSDKPTLKLTAQNPTASPAKSTYTLRVYSYGNRSPLSRVATQPKTIWERTTTLDLAAHEQRDLTVTPNLTLTPGQSYQVELATGPTQQIRPITFAVPAPAALQRVATARK